MFSSVSFYCQSKLKIHFNCIFLFIFMTDVHSASLSRLSPSLKLLSFPEELLGGSSTSGVPTCLWQPCTHGLGRGLNTPFSTTTFFVFFSQDIPSPGTVLFFQEAENQASNPRGFAPLPGVQYCSYPSTFRPWPASWYSCCSRPFPSPDQEHQGTSGTFVVVRRGQRVSKTSPEIEQTTLGDTATHRGTN